MSNNKNDSSEKELRTFKVQLRAIGGPGTGESEQATEIVGQAAVFNSLSEVLFDFREVIEPGFFENVLEDDVRALWNHNDDKPLGRTRNQTLFLDESETGLDVRILPPPTSWGQDALISVQRGDVDQMSFAFEVGVGGDEWRKGEDGMPVRVLKRGGCARLFDVSPVTYPAYTATSAQVRSKAAQFRQESLSQAAGEDGEGQAAHPAEGDQIDILRRRLNLAKHS